MGLDTDMAISRAGEQVLLGGTASLHRFALHPSGELRPLGSLAKKGREGDGKMREEQTGDN